jgi:hypothetical protein
MGGNSSIIVPGPKSPPGFSVIGAPGASCAANASAERCIRELSLVPTLPCRLRQQFYKMTFASRKPLVIALVFGTITSLALPLPWSNDLPQISENLITISAISVAYCCLALIPVYFKTLSPTTPKNVSLVLLAAPSVIVYFFVHLTVWPGLMTQDSINQWGLARHNLISDAMTATHSLFVWAASKIIPSPWLPIFLQYCLLAFAVGLALREAARWNTPRWLVIAASIVIPLAPFNFLMAVTLWKDIPSAAIMLILFTLVIQFVRTNGECAAESSFKLAFLISMALVMLLRHNSVVVTVGVPWLAWLLLRPKVSFAKAAALSSSFATLFVFLHLLYPRIGVIPLSKDYNAIVAVHVIGALASSGVQFDEVDRRTLDAVMPYDTWSKDYVCQSSVRLFWNRETTPEKIAAKAFELNIIALKGALNHPKAFLHHQICVTSMLWRIMPRGWDWISIPPGKIENAFGVTPPDLPFKPKLKSLYSTTKSIEIWSVTGGYIWLIWGPAIYLYLVSFVAAVLATVHHRRKMLLIAALPLLNTISLVPLIGSPDYRYQYGVVLISIISILLMFAKPRLAPTGGLLAETDKAMSS